MIRSFVAALLAASFALQLLLGGAGSACAMPGGGDSHMAMPAGDHAVMAAHSHVHGGHDAGAPCGHRSTAEACQVMAPCAGISMVAVSPMRPEAADVPAVTVSSIVTALSSRTIPPELPPPRA